MQKKWIYYLLLAHSLTYSQENASDIPNESVSLPPEIKVLKRQHETRALNQVLNASDNVCCACFQGKQLIACMAYGAEHQVRTSFAKMSLHQRLAYLYAMDLIEYDHFLSAFVNEEQWRQTLATLPPEEQQKLPQTIREQKQMIRDTWLECYERKLGHYSKGQKEPNAKDLAAWRDKTLETLEQFGTNHISFFNWLRARFLQKKIAQFPEIIT